MSISSDPAETQGAMQHTQPERTGAGSLRRRGGLCLESVLAKVVKAVDSFQGSSPAGCGSTGAQEDTPAVLRSNPLRELVGILSLRCLQVQRGRRGTLAFGCGFHKWRVAASLWRQNRLDCLRPKRRASERILSACPKVTARAIILVWQPAA